MTPEGELDELTAIYAGRGLSPDLARRVAEELTAGDVLAAHARDELRFDDALMARPLQAAWTSLVSFALGAAIPLLAVALAPGALREGIAIAATLLALALLGWLGARLGRAPGRRAALRVAFGGALALAVTMGVGALAGTAL